MEIPDLLLGELHALGLNAGLEGLSEIRSKEGVHVYRVKVGGETYVLKLFEKDEYTREIDTYKTLLSLGVPTITVKGFSGRALLLEDIEESPSLRLGIESDMVDPEVARVLAQWYLKLHSAGAMFVAEHGKELYRELDALSIENLKFLRDRTNTVDNPVWKLAIDCLPVILEKVRALSNTLTYNDFFWTNLVVSRDKTEAMMFDYNFLGVGMRYSDIRNVCSSLSTEAAQAFVKAYGGYDPLEKDLDEFCSVLVDLASAYQRPHFPKWAKQSLEAVHSGRLEKACRRII